MKYDYLIIGQGLAGSILSYQLLKRGKSIAIIDEQASITSSRVAAGLVNPITGRKMVKTWKAEVLFPYLVNFYKDLEIDTQADFFIDRTQYRPFSSVEELNDWYGKSAQPNYKKFIVQICDSWTHSDFVNDPYGGVEIKAYVLNVAGFVDVMSEYLSERCHLVKDHFIEDELEILSDGVRYKELEAKRIIYCNGHQIVNSKYFGWLPMAPVKGEILHVEIDKEFETIYNRSCFIIPQGGKIYKVGSTYDRHDMTNNITESGRNEICEKLESLSRLSYKVTGQQAGIRPGTKPRRPLIGAHPKHDRMFVFNGLGTKGVSLGPYFSDQFANCLEEGNYLEEEVDIKKYYSLYFNSQFYEES